MLQAPEQIKGSKESAAMRQSKATDVFSLALVLFFTLTNGLHPYGAHGFERDANIVHAEPDLSPLDGQREVQNLLRTMLHKCASAPALTR
jgi:serine/threonine protein kinase